MKIKTVLKRLLFENDMSVAQLARETEIPRQTIDNWLAGQEPRSFDQVKSVAKYFQMSMDELCFDERNYHESIDKFNDEINAGVFEVVLRRVRK